MFETGISAQQYGDNQQGTRTDAEKECERLILIAKAHGLYIPKEQWHLFGDRKVQPSGESIVYFDYTNNQVIKVRNPLAKAAIKSLHAQDIIYEHLIHNLLFPNTRYKFIGISEDFDGIRIILSQPYISDKYLLPTCNIIEAYLKTALSLHAENKYFYGNDYLSITDVSATGDNVLYDGERLYFIDPIIKLKRPAIEVLDYYYTQLQ